MSDGMTDTSNGAFWCQQQEYSVPKPIMDDLMRTRSWSIKFAVEQLHDPNTEDWERLKNYCLSLQEKEQAE